MPRGKEAVNYSVPGTKDKFSFDKAHTAKQSLADFQEHEKHTGLTEAQLKEVWQLARGTKEADEVKEGFVETPAVTEEIPETTTAAGGKGKGKGK